MRRRRRSLVLVPAALLSAACTRTRHDDKTVAEDALSRDLTLATQMENRPVDPAGAEASPSGGVCAAQPRPAAPTAQRRQQAVVIAQRAQQAELVGDTRTARDLFAQAAQLDATDKDVVYHLARADEALGRTGDAAREYCQYLSLVPGAAGAAEANARLAALDANKKARGGNGGTQAVASARTSGAWRAPATAGGRMRVSYTPAPSRTTATTASRSAASSSQDQGSVRAVASAAGTTGAAAGHRGAAPDAGASAPAVDTTSAIPPEAIVASSAQPQQSESRSAPARPTTTVHRQQTTARNAAIGAAAGAAVGGIMSRSAKGAGIGAIAGGLLGAMTGRGSGLVQTPGFAK